jgi:hypothetical protein
MPFQLKRLRDHLRKRGIGPLTIKKRGSPLEPEQLIRKLGLRGDLPGTVVLTRVIGKPYVLIVEPIEAGKGIGSRVIPGGEEPRQGRRHR